MLLRRGSPASPFRRGPPRHGCLRPMTSPSTCTIVPSVSRSGPVRMCVAPAWPSSRSVRTATAATSLGSMGSERPPRSGGGRRHRHGSRAPMRTSWSRTCPPAGTSTRDRTPGSSARCRRGWPSSDAAAPQIVVHGQRRDVDDAVRVARDRLDGGVGVFGARLVPSRNTTSTPSSAASSVDATDRSPRVTSMPSGHRADAGSRVSARTSAPSATRPDTTCRPTFPLAPVTRITGRRRGRTRRPPSSARPSATRPGRARASR